LAEISDDSENSSSEYDSEEEDAVSMNSSEKQKENEEDLISMGTDATPGNDDATERGSEDK
jgi:hypothetical protein